MAAIGPSAISNAFQRLPIAGKLLTVSAAAVLLLLTIGFSIVVAATQGAVSRLSTEGAFADARVHAESVARDVAEIGSAAQSVATAVSNSYDRGASRADIVRELRSYLNITPIEFGVWHMAERDSIGLDADHRGQPGSSPKGNFAPWWLRPGGKVTLDPVANDADYNADYYKQAHDQGRPALVEPYAYDVYGKTYVMMSVVHPVRHAGRIVGVAGMDMALDEMTSRLSKVQPFGVGRLLLVSGAGNWLVNPDAAKRMKPYSDIGKDVVRQVIDTGRPQSFTVTDASGVQWIRFVQPVELAQVKARWALISEIPAAAISAPAVALKWNLIACAIVVTIGLVVAILFAVRRLVGRPMQVLADAVDRLAHGEDRAIPSLDRADEIGTLARAADVFRQAAADRAVADARHAAEQARVTESIGAGLSAMRQGDLTAEIREVFPPAYEALRTNYNDALQALRGLIASVVDSAEGIRTGAMEISAASDDLARRTESNAASLEETSAALTQIDQRLRASASAAERTVARANDAIEVADDGKSLAMSAVSAMERVSESAKGIDSVIEALDKIAFQTRVLAMNAAVEAGRAGEAGRGFAVVADLVSALAMRSEEEAARAHEQLDAAQVEVHSAVACVEKVDGSFDRVLDEVREVHGLVDAMAADNRAQSSAISEISSAIAAMDHSTQQNAAMVEETSAAARHLHHESESLSDRASAFRTGSAPVAPASGGQAGRRVAERPAAVLATAR